MAISDSARGNQSRFVITLSCKDEQAIIVPKRPSLLEVDAVLVGGGAVPAALTEKALAAGMRLIRTYGSTETAGGIVYNGQAFEGVRFEFDADARVRVHSPTLAHCYRDGEPIASTGWQSSDRGQLINGHLNIVGRVDDIIKVAGHNVDLKRIQLLVESLESVRSCAVTSRPDSAYGAVPVIAYVGEASKPEIELSVRASLENISVPLHVLGLPHLPMLTNGKPDLRAISEL